MFNFIAKLVVGLLAGIGLFALGSKLLNKYYESLNDEDSEFDMDEFGEDEDMSEGDASDSFDEVINQKLDETQNIDKDTQTK